MSEFLSASDISKDNRLTTQAIYEAVRRGELTPSIMTKGGRMLFTTEETSRWEAKRRARIEARQK